MTEIHPQLAAGLARWFRLVRLLGAGGVGAVYPAEQIAVGSRPAIAPAQDVGTPLVGAPSMGMTGHAPTTGQP